MMLHVKSTKTYVVVFAWMGVLVAAFHQSDPAVVLGQYSWNYTCLLVS